MTSLDKIDSMHAVQSALELTHGFEDYSTELFKRHERSVTSSVSPRSQTRRAVS